MVNPKRGEVALQLGGTEWPLKLDWTAICAIEQAMGGKGIGEIVSAGSMSNTTLAITVGLRSCYPGVTQSKVAKMISDDLIEGKTSIKKLSDAVALALKLGLGEGNAKDEEGEGDDANPEVPVLLTGTG